MRRIVTIFAIIFVAFQALAQSASGRYVSRMTRDGTLYFVEPKKLSECEGIKKFEYDMTLLSWADSVTVNFTFKSASVAYPGRLSIVTCGGGIACRDYSLLFTDIVKGGYSIRVTSKFSIADLGKILGCASPPVFTFYQDGVARTASYSAGAWRKDRKKLNDIFNLYQLRK